MSEINDDLHIVYEMIARPDDHFVRMNIDRRSQEIVWNYMWFEGYQAQSIRGNARKHTYECLIHKEWQF